MQYFGAILLRSDLPPEEVEAHYSACRQDPWQYAVAPQAGQKIPFIEHGDLSFASPMQESETYYIVYTWGSGIPFFAAADIRGH